MTARLSRETALELLLAVAGQPYEARRDEWGLVMRAAGIKLSDIPAFQAAIVHSNWKAADNPIGYLLTVAAREARALRRDDRPAGVSVAYNDEHDYTDNGPDETVDEDGLSYYVSDHVPRLFMKADRRPGSVVDWQRLGWRGGLDAEVVGLLERRAASGVSRDKLAAECGQARADAVWRRTVRAYPVIRQTLRSAPREGWRAVAADDPRRAEAAGGEPRHRLPQFWSIPSVPILRR